MRLGFTNATSDLLTILDADLTTPPEWMPKFYEAIASGKGEFINGTRLDETSSIVTGGAPLPAKNVIYDLYWLPAVRWQTGGVATPIGPEETPPNLHINPYKVRDFSLDSLTKRLRVAGLPEATCKEVWDRGQGYYDAAWAEYDRGARHERRGGTAHPAGVGAVSNRARHGGAGRGLRRRRGPYRRLRARLLVHGGHGDFPCRCRRRSSPATPTAT